MKWLGQQDAMEKRLDAVGSEVLQALKVSEAEVIAVTDAPDLYARLRARIATQQEQQERPQAATPNQFPPRRLFGWNNPFGARALGWSFAAVAVVILLLAALPAQRWLPGSPAELASGKRPLKHASASPVPTRGQAEPQTAKPEGELPVPTEKPEPTAPPRRGGHRPRVMEAVPTADEEIATNYQPLTYLAEASASESEQVVRIRIPRSSLVRFGMPVNPERADELVKADVVVGDDGLARAIRVVQ